MQKSDVAEYLNHLAKERDVSPNTVTAYRRDLGEFTAYVGKHYGAAAWNWSSIDRLTMRGFLGHLQRRSGTIHPGNFAADPRQMQRKTAFIAKDV